MIVTHTRGGAASSWGQGGNQPLSESPPPRRELSVDFTHTARGSVLARLDSLSSPALARPTLLPEVALVRFSRSGDDEFRGVERVREPSLDTSGHKRANSHVGWCGRELSTSAMDVFSIR